MKSFKQHIFEKLKVSKEYKPEIDFTWYEFIKLVNKNNDFYAVSLLDIHENNKPLFKDF